MGRRGWYATPCEGLGVQRQHTPPLSPGLALRRSVGVGSPHQGTKTTKRKDLENLFCWAGTSVLLVYILSEDQKGILDAWLFGELEPLELGGFPAVRSRTEPQTQLGLYLQCQHFVGH